MKLEHWTLDATPALNPEENRNYTLTCDIIVDLIDKPDKQDALNPQTQKDLFHFDHYRHTQGLSKVSRLLKKGTSLRLRHVFFSRHDLITSIIPSRMELRTAYMIFSTPSLNQPLVLHSSENSYSDTPAQVKDNSLDRPILLLQDKLKQQPRYHFQKN